MQEEKYINDCLQFCAIYNLLVCSDQLPLVPQVCTEQKRPQQVKNKIKFETIKKIADKKTKKSKFQTVTSNSKTKTKQFKHRNDDEQLQQERTENLYQSRASSYHKQQEATQFSLNALINQLASNSIKPSTNKYHQPASKLWNNKFDIEEKPHKSCMDTGPKTQRYIPQNNNYYNQTPQRHYNNYGNQYQGANKNAYQSNLSNFNNFQQRYYGNQIRMPQTYNQPQYSSHIGNYRNIFPITNQKQSPIMNLISNGIQRNIFNRQIQQSQIRKQTMYSPVQRSPSPLNNSFSCRQFDQSPRQVSINRNGVNKSKSKKKIAGQRQFYQPKSARRIIVQEQIQQKQRKQSIDEQNSNLRTPELQSKIKQQRITDETELTSYHQGRVESKTSKLQDRGKKSKPNAKKIVELDDGLSQSISVLTQSRKVQTPIKINLKNKY